MKKLIDDLLNYLEDIFIFIGLILIIIATFLLSYVAGIYVTGVIFVLLGYYFAKYPPKKR